LGFSEVWMDADGEQVAMERKDIPHEEMMRLGGMRGVSK
jgi:hypothetical protein